MRLYGAPCIYFSKTCNSIFSFDFTSRHEAEEVSSIWQTGLWNNHVHVDRFMVEDDRAIFLFKVIIFSIKMMCKIVFFYINLLDLLQRKKI